MPRIVSTLLRSLCLACAVCAVAAPGATHAQVISPFYGNPIFGWNGGPWSLPAVNFGVVNFGVMNWYPVGWYNMYNPYAYYQAWAQSDYLATASAGLAEATYNVQSMQAGTISDANAMISGHLATLVQLDNMSKGNHGDRYNIETGRRWSMGRAGGTRLTDMTSNAGDVIWPLSAPNDAYLRERRSAANEAIRAVMREVRNTGRPSTENVSTALHKLADYATPAVDTMRSERTGGVHAFIEFVRDLDTGLRNLVGPVNVETVPKLNLDARKPPRPNAGG